MALKLENNLGNKFNLTHSINAGEISLTSKDLASTKLVDSITELKLISGSIADKLEVLGYYEKGDGGGGTFYWDATSTETDNGGTIIQATGVTTGRWKRVFSGAVNVKWFGAVGDGVTDDTIAIQKALDSLSNTSFLFFNVKCRITAPINVVNQNKLIGNCSPESKDVNLGSWFYVDFGENTTTPEIDAAIKLHLRGGIEGFGFYYPNQVTASGTTPIPYGWSISTSKISTEEDYNTDGIVCKKIMLLNSYYGLDLTNSAQFTVEEIYGHPIKIGLKLDKIYDVGTVNRVHFWTFNAEVGSNLYKWIYANGTAYLIAKADAVNLASLFAYGYNDGYDLTDLGSGGFWGSFVQCTADVCANPVKIQNPDTISFSDCSFTTKDRARPSVRIAGTISRGVFFNNCTLFGTAISYGMLVKSNGGYVKISNCYTNGTNINDFRLGIVHDTLSTTALEVNNCGSYYNHFLAPNDIFNGSKVPSVSTDSLVNESEFGLLSWSDGIPNGYWYEQANSADWIGQITDGAVLKNPGNYVIPYSYELSSETDFPLWGLSMTIKSNNSINTNLSAYFTTETDSAITSVFSFIDWCFEEDINIFIPLIRNKNLVYRYRFRIIKNSYGEADTTSTYEIKNLKLMQLNVDNNNSFIEHIKYSESVDVATKGKSLEMTHHQFPNWNKWNKGDRVINSSFSVGQPKAWICTASGTPGTWISEGNL